MDQVDLSFQLDETSNKSELYLNGERLDNQIRTKEVADHVSQIAAISEVRTKMVDLQQQFGETGGVVMDGRDIGTVVFPNAELKVFMTADIKTRAHRRYLEMKGKGLDSSEEEIERNLVERDKKDTTRATSPLVKAEGAIEVDTTNITFSEQVDRIVELAKQKIYAS